MKFNLLSYTVTAAILTLGSGIVFAETDCSNAKADLSHLQHEKKSTDERTVKGVLAILPIGLVVNAATSGGDKEADPNQEMEIKEYNKKIDESIAALKKNCSTELSD
jgi:hypothetical protein